MPPVGRPSSRAASPDANGWRARNQSQSRCRSAPPIERANLSHSAQLERPSAIGRVARAHTHTDAHTRKRHSKSLALGQGAAAD